MAAGQSSPKGNGTPGGAKEEAMDRSSGKASAWGVFAAWAVVVVLVGLVGALGSRSGDTTAMSPPYGVVDVGQRGFGVNKARSVPQGTERLRDEADALDANDDEMPGSELTGEREDRPAM